MVKKSDLESYYERAKKGAERKGLWEEVLISQGNSLGKMLDMDGKKILNFSSLGSLELGNHPLIIEKNVENLRKYGTGSPSTRSFLENKEFCDLAEKITEFKATGYPFFFNTGYLSSEGAVGILAGRNTVLGLPLKNFGVKIVYDQFAHMSMRKAMEIACMERSNVQTFEFPHADYSVLENILYEQTKEFDGLVLIIIDAVYSMQGDFCRMDIVLEKAKKYGALILSDGAHCDGLYGEKGSGIFSHQGITDFKEHVFEIMTFSKVFSQIGGCVTLPAEIPEALRFGIVKSMFSVGFPIHIAATLQFEFDLVMGPEGDKLRSDLKKKSDMLRRELVQRGFDIFGSQTHIVPIIVGNTDECRKVYQCLLEKNIFIPFVRFPGVPRNKALLRTSLMSSHTDEDIGRLIEGLVAAREKFNFSSLK